VRAPPLAHIFLGLIFHCCFYTPLRLEPAATAATSQHAAKDRRSAVTNGPKRSIGCQSWAAKYGPLTGRPAQCRYLAQREGSALARFDVGWKSFPHPNLSSRSVLSDFLGLFIFCALMFSFVSMARANAFSCVAQTFD
jgi:hypothetical protein